MQRKFILHIIISAFVYCAPVDADRDIFLIPFSFFVPNISMHSIYVIYYLITYIEI